MDWAKNVILDKFSSLFSFFKLKMGNRWIQRHWPEIQELSYIMKVREGDGTLLQYSRLENTMDGGAWWAAVHGVAKSRTRLSDVTFTFHFHALEKEMATHSSILTWRIPGTGEPGGLPSVGSHRVGHDWSDLAAAAAAAAWMGAEFGGEWIHVYVWLSPFSVHLKLSQHC